MNPPLLPLQPADRIGWLRHFGTLRCRQAFEGFTKMRDYPMRTQTVRIAHREQRKRRDGFGQTVHLTGTALLVILTADNGWRHRFYDRPPMEHPIVHDFKFLVEHFHIPEVPDVAALNPKAYATYVARLHALES